ncbi:hypothetical protein RUND412_006438 [Rhizina undulata]
MSSYTRLTADETTRPETDNHNDESAAHQPLIHEDEAGSDGRDGDGDGDPGWWIWILTFVAGISGLLFGYDTASISAALLHLGPSLSTPEHPVDTWDKSVITSCTSFGALFGGLFAGVLADRIGRKGVIWVADGLFFLGAGWQAIAASVSAMVMGRTVVGVGVGVGSLIVPLYISELSPPSHRGRLVVISVLCITFGQLVAYTVGLVLSPPTLSEDLSWRFILGLGAVPAMFQAVFMFFMPETPRWLVMKGRRTEAGKVIEKVYGGVNERTVERVLREIENGVETEGKEGLREKFRLLVTIGGNRRATILACLLQGLQQACGFNSLMYFSATIFSLLNFPNPTLTAMLIASTNALFTVLSFLLIDRVGRRRIILSTLPIMGFSLLICALSFSQLPPLISHAPPENDLTPTPTYPWSSFLLISLTTYVAAYATGPGPIPWLCQSEFFPMNVRGIGTGIATATCWVMNFLVGVSFLGLLEGAGGSGVWLLYAVVCGAGWWACWRIYPETRGLGMEEIEEVLRNGWGVKEGRERESGRRVD